MADAKLILPPLDFKDEEDLKEWLEIVKLTTLKASDELSDNAAHIHAVLSRYAYSRGISRGAARATARSVALPMRRGADALERCAKYVKTSEQRIDAYVEAVEGPLRHSGEFTIRGAK